MGIHPLITYDTFPEQSLLRGKTIALSFLDGTQERGIIVRDDVNVPEINLCIVRLDDGRYILIRTTNNPKPDIRAPKDETTNPFFSAGGYPKQGSWKMRQTLVCFHYNMSRTVLGTIVRDDEESPGEGIIALDDGRYVLTTECQYQLV